MTLSFWKNTDKDKLESEIKNGFRGLADNKIFLLLVKPERYQQAGASLAKYLANGLKKKGVIVTLTLPGDELLKNYTEHGIDCDKLHVIDATGIAKRANSPEYTTVSGPTSLVELSMKLTAELKKGDVKFLILDELTTLVRHNNPEIAKHFVQFIINKIRLHQISGIVMLSVSLTQQGIPEISQLVDRTIEI